MNITNPLTGKPMSNPSELREDQTKLINALRAENRPDLADAMETQLKLQNLQEAVSTATNIMKQLHDMKMSIINSMR